MQAKYSALLKSNTQILVPPPTNHKIIGCKWIYKLKFKLDGSIKKYKIQLMAIGFHQTNGFDYFEMFSPMVKQTIILIALSLALSLN